MATAIYARVSTETQAEQGFSIAAQLEACRQKAGNTPVIEYIDRGVSGSYLERPGLTKLREDLKAGIIDRVIIYDPDRLARGLHLQLLLTDEIDNHAELVFVNHDYQKTAEGLLFFQLRGAIAEFERAKIKERTRQGLLQKMKSGKIPRDPGIYGYDYDPEACQLTINSREAAIVKTMFELFVSPGKPEGVNGIATWLTENKIPTKRGGKWHRKVVHGMLRNETYIGKYTMNKKDWSDLRKPGVKVNPKKKPESEHITVEVPAIISEDLFLEAQKKLEHARRLWAGLPRSKYLLGGLCRCASCGNTMPGKVVKSGRKNIRRIRKYDCRKYGPAVKNPGCGNVVNAEEVENAVWSALIDFAKNPEKLEQYQPQQAGKNMLKMQLDNTTQELEKLNKGKERLISLLMEEDIPVVDIKRKLKETQETIEELEAKKRELEKQLSTTPNPTANFKKAASLFLRSDLDFDTRREAIRTVVKEILIYPDGNVEIVML